MCCLLPRYRKSSRQGQETWIPAQVLTLAGQRWTLLPSQGVWPFLWNEGVWDKLPLRSLPVLICSLGLHTAPETTDAEWDPWLPWASPSQRKLCVSMDSSGLDGNPSQSGDTVVWSLRRGWVPFCPKTDRQSSIKVIWTRGRDNPQLFPRTGTVVVGTCLTLLCVFHVCILIRVTFTTLGEKYIYFPHFAYMWGYKGSETAHTASMGGAGLCTPSVTLNHCIQWLLDKGVQLGAAH